MRNKFEVYPGAKIGRWMAQERITTSKLPRWCCVCECGTERDVLESSLIYGYTLSCGCAKSTKARTVQQDLVGKRFGDLTVLHAVEKGDRRFSVHWLCHCDCGNEIEVGQKQLLTGVVQNCGCRTEVRYRDITGQRFGRLTAVHPLDQTDERGSKLWHCVCDCVSIPPENEHHHRAN